MSNDDHRPAGTDPAAPGPEADQAGAQVGASAGPLAPADEPATEQPITEIPQAEAPEPHPAQTTGTPQAQGDAPPPIQAAEARPRLVPPAAAQPLPRPEPPSDPVTGPLTRVAPVSPWQVRPSGALSDSTGTGSYSMYPPDPTVYGSGAYAAYRPLPSGAGAPPPPHGPFAGVATMPPAAPPPERRRGRTAAIIAATVILALGAGFGGGVLGANVASNGSGSDTLISQAPSANSASLQTAPSGSVQQVAAKLLPSVVSILSSSREGEGEGSGVILTSDGLVLTNNHVVAGADSLTVRFNDGSTAQATVVGTDATDDLAVIKVQGMSGLTKATLGRSADLQVGQQVVAVGSPLGLSATVTSGIVSALNRPVRTSDSSQGQGSPFNQQPQSSDTTVLNAIQTDAAINPGNSGGPLVDMQGRVIGINSAIAAMPSNGGSSQSGNIGVGFAIPIDQAYRIAQEIINTGHATHAVLGASVSDAAADGNSVLTVGAKVAEVSAGGAADKAGLKTGDVITKIGSQPIDSADALIATVRSQAPGSTVQVTYQRDGGTATANVTLGSATSN